MHIFKILNNLKYNLCMSFMHTRARARARARAHTHTHVERFKKK